jgi:hypothetical protein
MSFLIDLVAEVSTGGMGPSTSRAWMVLGLIVGIGLCGVNGWLLANYTDPLHEREWALELIGVGMIIPPVLVLLSTLTIRREPEERRWR